MSTSQRSVPSQPALLVGLGCSACRAEHGPDAFGRCTACASPLLCRYDLPALRDGAMPVSSGPARRGAGVFRWAALLPVRDPARRLSLGEGDTPLLPLPRLAHDLGLGSLHVKDESGNPSGSFKARGLAVSLAAHAERGARAVTLPTAGNAGAAAAAYARVHGLGCRIALPSAAAVTFREEQRLLGARVVGVTGDIAACADWTNGHPGPPDDHLIATFAEPFRVEGKKTLAFELWEALGEELPDAIVHPTGGGTGLVGLAKGFAELRGAGLLHAATPRLVAAQTEGCAPLVRAFMAGADDVEPWEGSRRTLAEGLRVPRLAAGRLALAALRDTQGQARAVSEGDLIDAIRLAARSDGVLLSAEGGAALAALRALRADGELGAARVVLVNTASIYKSAETLAACATG